MLLFAGWQCLQVAGQDTRGLEPFFFFFRFDGDGVGGVSFKGFVIVVNF
jgi:hypothetical protein